MIQSRVLITGANGLVGRALTQALAGCGVQLRCVMRSDIELAGDIDRVFAPSIDESNDWTSALYGVDVIIHLAARVHIMRDTATDPLAEFSKVNVEGTLNLARQAVIAGVKRFIFISSIKVNGEFTELGKPFTENDATKPQDAYGMSKQQAEQGLLAIAQQAGMEVVIIRPPLVYGAGVKANFANMMRAVKRGFPLPLGAIHNKRSFVYLGNLVDLIVRCIDHPAAANQVFLVSDGYDLSTTELLRACAKAEGVRARLFPIPQCLIEICATLVGKQAVAQRLCGNLQVDITKARTMLGWNPPFTVEEGLKATVKNSYKINEK